MRLADDRGEVVLAVALEADVAQHDHLVVALDLLEGALEHRHRVLLVAAEPLAIGAHHAAGRVEEALALRVVAGPAQERLHRLLGLGHGGPLDRLRVELDQRLRIDPVHPVSLHFQGRSHAIRTCPARHPGLDSSTPSWLTAG